jgi:predicted nuclease of predicted toxin-antitoxin system
MAAAAPLFIRLYLDEDVHRGLAAALRIRQFDAVSAHDIGRRGAADAEQLAWAAAEQRALFTFNTVDFLRLHQAWIRLGQSHWGIIVCEQTPVGETMRRLLRLLNHVTADDMREQIYWLQSFR